MTVQATVDSTLNGQSADLILIEDAPDGARQYETKSLSGGSENLVFTGLDGGSDKEYTAKIVPSTSDVTQTSEVNYGATIEIDPIPHRDADADSVIRENAEFNNGVVTRELGLGDNPLIHGLLTSALADGEVLADDGYVYSTVQAAQDAASSWIFIGPGTFNENVTVDTSGLTIKGSGYDTLIDGGTTGTAVNISASNVTVRDLSVQTTAGATNDYRGVDTSTGADSVTINKVTVRDSDSYAISVADGNDHIVNNCRIENAEFRGIRAASERTIVSNCNIQSTGDHSIQMAANDLVVVNNIILNSAQHGIIHSQSDSLIGGNRIQGSGDNGISIFNGADNIVFNNRVSDSTNRDIDNLATNTTLDGNNTGASN